MYETLKKLYSKEELSELEIKELMVSNDKYKYDNTKFLKYRNFNKYNYGNYLSLSFDYNEIDPLLQEIIVNLNVAGLHTRYSCSGHNDKNVLAGYIFFQPNVPHSELYKLFNKLNIALLKYSNLSEDQLSDRSFYHPDMKLELTPILDEGGTLCSHILRWNCAERYQFSNFYIDKTKVVANDIFLGLLNKIIITNLIIDGPCIEFDGNIVTHKICGKVVTRDEYEVGTCEFEKTMEEILGDKKC